jgi:hypothetical protein
MCGCFGALLAATSVADPDEAVELGLGAGDGRVRAGGDTFRV